MQLRQHIYKFHAYIAHCTAHAAEMPHRCQRARHDGCSWWGEQRRRAGRGFNRLAEGVNVICVIFSNPQQSGRCSHTTGERHTARAQTAWQHKKCVLTQSTHTSQYQEKIYTRHTSGKMEELNQVCETRVHVLQRVFVYAVAVP